MPTIGEFLLNPEEQQVPQGRGTTIEQFLLSSEPQELRAAPGPRGSYPEPEVPQPGLVETYGAPALRMAGPTLGAVVGSAVPAVGTTIGGAIGGALGESGARYLEGKPQALLPTAVAAAGGAFFPGPEASLGESMAKAALANAGLTAATRLAEGEMPHGTEVPISMILGAAGGAASHVMAQKGAPLPERTSENPLPAAPLEPLPRVESPQMLARPIEEPPVSPIPLRTRPPEELTPLLGRDVPEAPVITPAELPQPRRIFEPGPEPNPNARIVSPSGEPFPADTEAPLRHILTRRGLPEQEVNRILAETAPIQPELQVNLVRPNEIIGNRSGGGAELVPSGATASRVHEPIPDLGLPQPPPQEPLRLSDRPIGLPEQGQLSHINPPEQVSLIGESSPIRDMVRSESTHPTSAEVAPAANATLTDILQNQQGSAVNPLVSGIARAGVGAAIGGTQGDTTEERIRNAAIGAGVGALASPALLSSILKRGQKAETPPLPPAEAVVQELGAKARQVEALVQSGNFADAHAVADAANANIERLIARAHEITPDNRINRVIAAEFAPAHLRESVEMTATGAGQLLQRYSALAQRLEALARQGDAAAAQASRVLFGAGERGPVRQIVDFWRASLVGRVSTGVRNAFDQGTVVATGTLDKFMAGVAEGIRTGKPLEGGIRGAQEAYQLGAVATRRAWQGTTEFLRLAQREPDVLAKTLEHFQDQAQKLLAKPEGMEGITQKYLRVVNAVNNTQEEFFRKVWVEAELRNGLAQAGINADEAFRNPTMIPQPFVEKAVSSALSGTFQNSPRGELGRDIVHLFADHPGLHMVVPFPRYIANRMQYIIDHNPLAFVRLFTQGQARAGLQGTIDANQQILEALSRTGETVGASKAAFNIERATAKMSRIDTPGEIVGKWLSGLTAVSAGAALRDSSIAGEHWYEVKPAPGSDKRIDMRPFSTLAGFMFVGELAREIATQGKITMASEDITQGVALAGMRSGVGLTLVDMVSGRGNVGWDGIANLAADLAGMAGAGFLNPISQTKDIAALGDPNQAKLRETRDTPAMRAYGPIVNQVPYLRDILPEAASPTSSRPKALDNPAGHFFGVNIDTKTPIEQELARLGIQNSSIYPRESDKADQRIVTRGQGQILGREANAILQSPEYRSLSRPEKTLALKDLLTQARNAGLAEQPQPTIERILLRRKPKEVQEILQQRSR